MDAVIGSQHGSHPGEPLPAQANGSGQAYGDHASLRTDPNHTERLTGIYGSEGWGFESLRARPGQQPIAILQRPLLLPNLLPKWPSSCPEQLIDRVGSFLAKRWQHVRVGVHRHADPGVPEHFHDRP
jgi:hypothetical protein